MAEPFTCIACDSPEGSEFGTPHTCPPDNRPCDSRARRDPRNRVAYDRFITDLKRAQDELAEFYDPKDIMPWLRAPHKLLKGARAIDLLGTDRAQEVWAVLDQMKSGAYI